MLVALIGGTGFIGRALGMALAREGHAVTATHRHAAESIAGVELLATPARALFETLAVALRQAEVAVIVNQPDRQFSQAVSVVLDRSPVKKIIYVSSLLVYQSQPFPVTEAVAPVPISDYEQNKFTEEQLFYRLEEKFDRSVMIARLGNVYGPGNQKGVVYRMLKAARERTVVTINGSGENIRDYIFIEDIVEWLKRLIIGNFRGIFNLATGVGHSLFELHALIQEITGETVPLTLSEALPEKENSIGNNQRIVGATGYAPRFDLRKGLVATWASLIDGKPILR